MTPEDIIQARTIIWSATMFTVAISLAIFTLIGRTSFGLLGTNCTQSIREVLYKSILMKNMGWFDESEHAVSVLTSAMASDTQLVNGTATESFGPQVEGAASMIGAIIIAFYFCWKMAVVCLVLAPFLTIGKTIAMRT